MAKLGNDADTALQETLNRLASSNKYVIDVETSGLDWKTNHIVGYVVTFGPHLSDSYYIPFRHAGGHNVGGRTGPDTATGWSGKLERGEKELISALDCRGRLVFGHNLAFDLKMMHRVGFTMNPRLEDTMINAPLIDEFAGRYSLAACAKREGVEDKKEEEIVSHLRGLFPEIKTDREAMGHYWRTAGNDKIAVAYARGDGVTTWQLRDKQMVKIQSEELERVHDVESRLIPVLVRMMTLGVKIDTDRVDSVLSHLDDELDKLNATFPSGFNPLSSTDVRGWVAAHGRMDWPYTAPSKTFPNGKPSFNEEWLSTFDAGKQIIKLRKYNNIKSSFLSPLLDRHMFNGRVHTQFNQLRNDEYGTVTGRLSSSDPNMQQVPKHNEELGRLFRSVFVPDTGMTWGAVDFSQCEPRLLAYYSQCKVLVNDYCNNPYADAHMAVTKATNERQWESMTEEARKAARNIGKRINQTLITGGGKGVLVKKYKVPQDIVDRVWNDYFKAMPEIKILQKQAARRFRERGYVKSLLGRRARLQDPNRDYTALNRLLQCGNADIIKVKMVEIDEYLQSLRVGGKSAGVDMLLNCHDAVDFQFVEGCRPVYEECLRIMQDFSSPGTTIKLNIPMKVDAGEGPNWAIATYGEE